jgi:hypothetical protein
MYSDFCCEVNLSINISKQVEALRTLNSTAPSALIWKGYSKALYACIPIAALVIMAIALTHYMLN